MISKYFDVRGLDVKDVGFSSKMLTSASDASESINLETFVGGCMRLKGLEPSTDVHTLNFKMKLFHQA